MFTGLSAFPLTPVSQHGIDAAGYARLVSRLAAAGVDSITALGSTGSFAYLTCEERRRVTKIALGQAGSTPVIVGISALRTEHVLRLADYAQASGAAGVLLAPMSYQPLTPDDVLGLYQDISRELSIPLILYDNPGTTHFTFTDELYAAIAGLPCAASIKLPDLPLAPGDAAARVGQLRRRLPANFGLGISGDPQAALGLVAGCDTWYSVIAGTFPEPALAITRAAQAGHADLARALSRELEPLWQLFDRHGSLRVIAAAAEHAGLVDHPSLPRPILGVPPLIRTQVIQAITSLGLDRHR